MQEKKWSTTCLLCNASSGVSTRNSVPIFECLTSTSERPLVKLIGFVLGLEITVEDVHSTIICKKCFKLCDELDELEDRLSELKQEISTNYQRTLKRLEEKGIDGLEENEEVQLVAKSGPGPGRPRKRPVGRPPLVMKQEKENTNSGPALESRKDDENEGLQSLLETTMTVEENEDSKVRVEGGKEEGKTSVDKNDPEFKVKKKCFSGKRKKSKPTSESIIPQMVVGREGNEYNCLLCSVEEKFKAEAKEIITHMKETHQLRLYICDICGQEFLKRTELFTHLDEHVNNEDGDFQCEICNRIFNNLRLFRVHKKMHYPQAKNWTCELCGKRYGSKNMLEEHRNVHTGNRPYCCSTCGKSFASKYTFRSHERTHEERDRPFTCINCGKTFLTQQNLIQHERTHSGLRNYVCQECGKAFGTARNLEVHCVIHTGFKPFICRMCGKAFARKAEIKDHERTHTGEKPYQCEFCGATFSQRSNLQSHKRATHYDDKRYKCLECGRGFKRRRLLDYHMKAVHTGERPFKCSICNATFIYPEHFKKHRRIHTGEKPYECEVCGKAFNSRDNRNAHRFVHSDKKPYECLVCGMGFMRKPLLYNHMEAQGHMNDTIVVNQPRLTPSDTTIMTAQDTATGVEMTIVTDADGNHKLVPADQVAEFQEMSEDERRVFIAELKDHVIIQSKEPEGEGEGEQGELIESHQLTDAAVEQLIIDGQVHFASASEVEHVKIVPEEEILVAADGTEHLIVPADDTNGTEFHGTTTVETEDGPVHLVQIRLEENAAENGDAQKTWFNIVTENE